MNPQRKIIIAAFSFVLLGAVFVFLIIVPLFQGIQKDATELLSQRAKVTEARSLDQYAADFVQFSADFSSDFKATEALFVDAETPIGFIKFLEQIAARSNLRLKIVPGTPKKVKGEAWPSMEFQLSFTGTYPEIFVFTEKLENAPFLLEIQNVTISRTKTRPLQGEVPKETVSFTLLLRVFTGPLKESIKAL